MNIPQKLSEPAGWLLFPIKNGNWFVSSRSHLVFPLQRALIRSKIHVIHELFMKVEIFIGRIKVCYLVDLVDTGFEVITSLT